MRTLKTKAPRIRLPFFLLIFREKEKRKKKRERTMRQPFLLSPFSFLISKGYYMMPRSRSSSCHFQAVLSESSSV